MKKYFALVLLLFLTGCGGATEIVYQDKIEYVYVDRVVEVEVIKEVEVEKEVVVVHEVPKVEYVEVPTEGYKTVEVPVEKIVEKIVKEEVPRELTTEEMDKLKAEIAAGLTPEVIEVPIAGDEYEHWFEVCTIKQPGKEDLILRNGNAKKTILGSLFTGAFVITLEQPTDDGHKQFEFTKEMNAVAECVFTLGGE